MSGNRTAYGADDFTVAFDSTGFNASITAGSSTVNVSSSSYATVAVTGVTKFSIGGLSSPITLQGNGGRLQCCQFEQST